MRYALNLSENGRILSATYDIYAAPNAVLGDELPEGNIADYLYLDGQYIYDPLPQTEEPENQEQDSFVTWGDLDAAYQEGYAEGYQEGVNSAYD